MKGIDFKPIDPRDIPTKYHRPRTSKYAATLAEFVKSGAKAVEIDVEKLANPSCAANSLRTHMKDMKLEKRVAVISRQGRVFLVRTAA